MAERPLYTLYKNLKAQNYDVPDDYNKFESALTRDGKGGADNRHAIYENLKAQNFDVPDTYERFYSALFEPRSKTSSRAKGGSVPMTAADRARFSAGAQAISASAQQTMNNAGRYNKLKQRKQKQQKDFGRVNLGTHQTPYGGDANNVVKDDFAYNPETGKAGAYITSDNENVYSLPEAEQSQAQDAAYQNAVDTGEIPSALDVRDKKGNYDLQENIGKNGTYLTEEGAQKQFDKKLADAYARKKEIEALIAEDNRQHGNPLLSYGASIGASNGRTAEQSDYRNKLATSLSLVTEQIGALEAVKQYPTSSWGEDALKALDNTAFTAKTWDFGLTDFATMGQMERIKTKMDNNIPLSGSDKMLLKSKLGADAAAALEDEKMGNIYRWTKIAGQSLPFMLDFFMTGGYGGITKGISRGALKFAAKRGMGKVSAAILKNTGIVAGDVIGSYAMAGTEQALKTGADIMQRHLGNLYQDEKGDYKFGTFDENGNLLHEGGESMGTALYKGLTSAMVENYTEKLFGHSYGIKKGAVAAMEKHGMSGTAQFFKNIGKSGWYTNSKKWMEKFGINGFGEEVMEEEIGIPLHALLDGDNKFSDLGDAKQQLDIIGGMAISVGSMYAMGAGSRPVKGIYNRAQYYRFRNKVNVADSDAQNLIGDNWADIKDKIDNATNEQMGGVLAGILRQRDTMSKEQINAAVNYGVNLMKMRGYNIAKTAEMNAREITNEPTTPEEQHQTDIDNAYSEGHDADDADKHDIQIQHEDQMKTLAAALGISEQQLSAMSDDELQSLTGQDDKLDQAIYDYQLSSARYQGVVDDAQDKVDLAAHQAEQRVDMYTDQSRGSVRNATIKASGGLEDYGVYIISGNIATHDDGSIDVSNSDDMILYYDPTTNSVEHADAMMFVELGEELPADDVKTQAVADAKENAIKEIAGIIDGTVEVGSQFSITDADGTEHTYEVLADNGDGTAMITIDGNVSENPYSLADLQQMKDMEDQKRLEAAKAEREQMENERAAQQTQETEQTQPSFDFNQILNDDGNVVLVDVLDEDGNTKYPDSKLFLIRDAGAKAKVVELKSDGTIVPHAVNKEDVATISSMSLDEYKQAMPETSMIEDNSGVDRGGIEVESPTIEGETAAPTEETAAPESAEAPATEQTPAAPAIALEDGTIVPMLEDGNPDFSKLTAAQTAELYDSQFGDDADSIVSGYVTDAKKALDKARNMTVKGKTFVEQKAAKDAKEKAIADAQAAYDSAIAIRDAYSERQLAKVEDTAEGRKNLIEKARRKFARLKSAVKDDAEAVAQLYKETVGTLLHRLYDGTGIDVTDTIPLTAEEYVASNLGAHSLNYEGTETSKGVKQETGLSREDFAKTQLLAADGKGTTIDALVHSLWENRPSNLESLDTQDIRNALIGVLNSGFKASEARNFVENIRIAQAENILEEQKRAQENAAYAEQQKAELESELKAKSDEKAESEAKSEEKLDNETDNEKTNDNINDNINTPEDATDENPLGAESDESDLPFSARDNGTQQTTAERAADVEKNKVDDMKVVDNIVGQKTRKAFERLAKMMGASIQWQYSDKLGNGWIQETTDADGNVHRTIFITLDSSITEGAQFIFGHEMTHQIKNLNPAAYNELTQLVLDTYGSDAFDKAVDETMQRYSDAGLSGRAREYYAEEVVADAVGEMIRDLNLAHTLAMKMSHPLLAAIHEILQKIKLAFFGTEYSDVTKNIIRSIEQAYVKTAKGEVTNSETGEDVSFSLRQKPEPKKKGIGYKVFVLKDGKLYPPMVANPNGAETPVGVWLDADAAPIAGESKTGRPQVKQGGKGTQGGSGKLAYRPGWHLGVVPYAIQFNRKDADGNKTLFPKNFVFAEVEYAADVDYQEEARQEGINPSGKYQHSLAGLKHLPTDGYYMYRTNPNPKTDPWVITGAMKVNRILTRAEQAELVKNAGREPQQIQEGDIVTDDVVNSINQEIVSAPKFSLKVYHGSGADFTEFDFDHMGEGAGSQAFGWGGYVTSSKKIGKSYATMMDNDPSKAYYRIQRSNGTRFAKKYPTLESFLHGDKQIAMNDKFTEQEKIDFYNEMKKLAEPYHNLYEVDIPEDNGGNYLDWDAPITDELIDKVAKALPSLRSYDIKDLKKDRTFDNFYKTISMRSVTDDATFNDDKAASKLLSSLGYTGIKYKAGRNFGGAEVGDTNYVIFKPENMRITEHTKFSIKTYHGSQASFDKFDHSFMGSGEGAQAYGWGTYVSEVEGIAKAYAKQNAAKHGMPREYKIAQTRLNHAKYEYDKVQRAYDNSKAYIDSLKEDLQNYKESLARRKEKVAYFAQNDMPETVDKLLKQIKRTEETIRVTENDINQRTGELERWKPKLEEVKKKYEEEQKKFDAIPKPQIERNLYSVDIPDDTGENYIGWDEKMTPRMRDIRKEILEDNGYKLVDSDEVRDYFEDRDGKEYELFKEKYKTGGTFYEELAKLLHSQKLASLALKEYGFDGVKVIAQRNTGGNKEGKMNYVIFDENNAQITSHTKFSLKSKPVRFEAGKKLSDEEKKEVLSTLKDAYKVNGVPYHIEETAGGKEKRVYEPTADSYVVSDITNRPLRYYITLPDGRVAHPTEVYPNISDNEVKSSATKQGLLDDEVDQIVGAAIGKMKDIADNAKAVEVLTELQNLPHETHDVGYGLNHARSYNYKTGIFTSDAAQAIDYVVRRMRRKEDIPAEIPAALKKAVADSYGMVDNLIDGMSSAKFSLKDIEPVGKNQFGDVYDQFKGKPKEAFDFLLENKDGYLKGVFHRDEIGDIDLAYGSAPNPYKGKGLAHIIRKHVETLLDFPSIDDAINTITDVISNGVVKDGSIPNTYDIENGDYRVVVAADKNGNWVLTAFDYVNPTKKKKKGTATALPPSQSSDGAGAVAPNLSAAKIDNSSETAKKNGEKVDSEGTKFSLKDEEYLKAVEDGNMEKAQKMVNEAADAAGYSTDSSYQGTSAFNGAAPWGNGYFLTKDERKEAWDNGEFEGESTLGDYINDDIDGGNLEELTNAASYRAADPMRKEAIDNVRNAILKKAKTITMYRSVPSDVKEGSFRNGDWVTPSRAYAVDNAKLHGWGDDYNIIEQKVPVDDVWFDGNDIAEWGYGREEDYINDTDFAYKNSKNNKKLLDAVTYDDNGNVIPLSQRFNEKNKDVRFSLKDEKTMFGMHNISIDKLRKAIKQGGFAAPSMGVVDSKNGIYSDYGAITLIPKAEKLAKSKGKNAGTFTADAWTPVYPKVEKIMTKQGEKAFDADMNKLYENVDVSIWSNIRDSWKSYLLDGDIRDGLYFQFLQEKGMKPEVVRQKGKYDKSVWEKIESIVGADGVNKTELSDTEVSELLKLMNEVTGEDNSVEGQRKALEAEKKDAEKQGNALLIGLLNRRIARLDGEEDYWIADGFMREVAKDISRNGKVKVLDSISTARQKVVEDDKLAAEFNSWLDKKSEQYEAEEMLYNGTTPTGKPKYIPNTIENAVKLMKKQGLVGGYNTFHPGVGAFIAKLSPQVNTLAAMKKAKDKLIPFGDKRHNEVRDKILKEHRELARDLQIGESAWDDSGEDRMQELAEVKPSDLKGYIKRNWKKDVSDDWVERYNDLVNTIKNDYPVYYFETKFMRPYGLDEFEKAIVPSDTPSDVVDALKKAGIDVSSYERGNAEDRQKVTMDAINSSDNIRFSLAGERGAAAADKAEERTIRMDNLSVARKMEEEKKDAKAIKIATGWERGADSKWRYEMHDAKIKDTMNVGGGQIVKRYEDDMLWNGGKLSEVIDAPELFKAYPQLKDVRIETDAIMNDMPSNGEYNSKTNTITIHADELKYMNSILNHEIQHAIQDIEGFAKGGSPRLVRGEVKKKLNEVTKQIRQLRAEGKEDEAKALVEKNRGLYNAYQKNDDYNSYVSLAGEVEARNVSVRLNMTPEERRKTLAESTEDVARKDQIFLGVGDVSFSLRDMADGKESGAADMAEELKSLNTPDEVDDAIKTAIEDMPSGWKMANKKMIHVAQALGENRKAEIAGEEPKFSLKGGTLIKAGTYFSGGGLVEEGLKGIIDPVVAVEYDEKISGVYRNNFGQHIVTADVRDVDPKELVKQIDGEVEYFHASPVCKNYSQAKSNHAEVELDKETAASTAEFINAVKPNVVTIENVKGYKDSDAMKTITDALDVNGYTWDADVYNAADYGGYTNRERLIVRAVRDGKLPAKPKKMARKSGWYEAVADIIPTLTEKKNGVAPWMDIRLKADGIDWRNIDKPLYVMGSAYADGKVPHAFADELLPTLRTKSGDVIVMPDGKVYRAMGRVLARVSGVSDDYKMPFSENLSHTIIGNGIPTQLTEHVIAPLLTGSDPKFSIRTYHGTGASFDKFDLSHALEGEGSETFGHGVYVTNSSKIGREYAQRAKNRKMEDLYKNMRYPDGVKGDIFKRRVFGEMVNDVATGGSVASAKEFAKKRVGADANDIQRTLENLKDREKGTEYEQNLKDRLAEYKEALKWIDSLDEDYLTQGNVNRYDVDIPDDNGSNYLGWNESQNFPLEKWYRLWEITHHGFNENEYFNDGGARYDKDMIERIIQMKLESPENGMQKLPTLKGEELYHALEDFFDRERPSHGAELASRALSEIGFVGIKYPAGMIHGGAVEGDYNYVIFDENNANIVGNTRFSLRYDKFEHDLNQWKKDNNLPKDAQRPTIPQRNAGESAVDFLRRVDEYRKQMALWKTAPTYEQHLLSDDTALGEFNRELQRGSVLKRIAFQDSMLAIRKAQEAIMKEVGVDRLNMAEDAYTAENRSHGKGKNEFEEYNNEFLQPLRKAYHQMKKMLGDSYDNVRIYMMAKHGLERDAQMAFKKSLEADYEDVAQRSAAYKAYKGDMNRIINDSDLEFGRVDFNTWRQRDNALRTKYSPSYMNYRYDKNGIAYDYSGLSALFDGSDFEEAAYKLVKDIEDKYVTEAHNLWDATNAATKKILRDGYKAGMMSKDTYQYVRDMYSHYIPLRGWDGTTADQVWDYIGGGKGAFNQTLKTAHGRTSLADDPIAYIENMAESGILLNNKNWVKQHLMLLAQNHPTSLLTLSKAWYVKSTDANGNEEWIPATPQITSQMNSNQVKAAIDAFEQKMEQMAQTGDATQQREGLNIAYPQTHSEEREHEVRVMKDGEEYVIYVNGDPQLAQAMNNTRAHRVREIQSGKLDRAAAWLGRKMAAAYTSLSPLFIPSNYFRDLTMTLASTAIREDAKYNYLLRKNLATSWNLGFMLKDYQNGKLREKVSNGNATPKEQMFYDFMMNGGETGFVSSLDVEDLKKKFKNDLKDLDRWKANPVKVGHTIMDSIEFLNRMIEDSNRFAVYMTSIQYGRSIDEAVNDAKDVTLNFNRKGTGEYGWQMIRNLYLFINPAVQSLQTLGALAKHHPFKFTAVTASWLASGVLVPIVNAALMSLLGGDDDKDKYWQFTKWDRRNNLIMWVPFTHEYVKIPLAQEFRAFYGVGDMIASKMMGGELAEESWSQYAEDLLGQVVDMLPLDPTGYDGNIAVSLMPNAIRPVFELAFNVDFTGKPLFKETEYNKYDPNFTKAYVGTPDWLVRASKMVNSIGNDYPDVQQNGIDAFGDPRYNLNNPAVVDHVLSSYLGGAYTMGSQVLGVLTKSLNDPKEIKVADIPLFSKFVSNPDDRPVTKKQGDEFWDMKENHDRAANTLSKLKKQAKVDGDYSLLERFYGSEEYKQYKQDDVKVKKYEEDKKKERAEESGEEYRPHKLNAEDIYKAHATPKDDFEDLKLKQLYTKLNGFKSAYDLLVDTAPSQSDGYYNTNKAAIDAIDEISLDKQEISELKKGFLDDGKDAYNAEDMKQIRELRKKILAVLEKANKVVVANQKAKTEK